VRNGGRVQEHPFENGADACTSPSPKFQCSFSAPRCSRSFPKPSRSDRCGITSRSAHPAATGTRTTREVGPGRIHGYQEPNPRPGRRPDPSRGRVPLLVFPNPQRGGDHRRLPARVPEIRGGKREVDPHPSFSAPVLSPIRSVFTSIACAMVSQRFAIGVPSGDLR
jgi:hypothetical protein